MDGETSAAKRASVGGSRIEPADASTPERSPVPFAEALRFWIKLGFVSFGGPAGQIAIMHREVVERRRWLSEKRFLHALNYCLMLPGPEAQQLAIYIGWLLHRTIGGIVAGVFFVVPSIFVLLGLSYVYAAYGKVPAIAGVLGGFKPVVVAIVVGAISKIGKRALKAPVYYLLAASAFVAIYVLHIPFPVIVLAAGAVGFLGARAAPRLFAPASSHEESGDSDRAGAGGRRRLTQSVVDDDASPPSHTLPSGKRSLQVLAVGVTLWSLPLAALIAWRGWDGLHAHEYRFFSQAALVTFGGAYAVLAYVNQAAAGVFGWISHAQAIDGLALAETTPGPLIMVLQFVGFMAGWNNPGSMGQTASAVTGALVTTYATFLPCFIFIFLGGPYIETLRGNRSLNSFLSGITAAVVGVILNLALVFGLAVVWPSGLRAAPDWFAAAVAASALFALERFKIDVLWIVLAGGSIGLLRVLLF